MDNLHCSLSSYTHVPQGLNRRISFRTTPHGPILAKMPVLQLNGHAFGDLSWYQGDVRLLLALTKCNRPRNLPYPIYDIGVDVDDASSVSSATPPVRLVKIHNLQDNVLVMHTNIRIPLRTLLLVRRQPREGPDEPIHLPLNHSFPPSIRLPEHLFRLLLNRPTVTEVSITNAQLPWSGDPPFVTTFRVQAQADVLYATVLIGRCTSHTTDEETGSVWATFRGGLSTWACTEGLIHQCTADHVLNWPGLKRRFVVEFHANDDRMGDHISKWLFHMEFTLGVHTKVLVLTHITYQHRVLFRAFGYHDSLEGKKEWTQGTQEAPVAQEFPVSTRGQQANGSSTLTTTLEEDPQSAAKSCVHRLCPKFLFHRLACTCFAEPFVNPFRSLPSVFIRSLHLDDPLGNYIALAFLYSATLHWNGLGYNDQDLSLLLP